MTYTILTIDCSFADVLITYADNEKFKFEIISSSSHKLELIDHVDRKIDVIYICNNDKKKLKELIYFFREFNQLLEFTPIVVSCNYEVFKDLLTIENVGIIDFVKEESTIEEKLFRLNHNCSFLSKTEEIRDENYKYRTELSDNLNQLKFEMKRSEELLLNILPEETSRELMIHGQARPQKYKKVSVLFTDFVGFTSLSETMEAEDIIKELDYFFSQFDEITSGHFAEKIKTIGDAYMCAGGIPMRNNSNPIDMVLVGLEMQQFVKVANEEKKKKGLPTWNLRVGIHTGKLVAGVIGKKKFAYDIWGDTVNTAARMESSGEPLRVNISGRTYGYVKNLFDCTYRGKIYAKNKGEIDMYFVDGIKPEFSVDGKGVVPNAEFNSILSQL